MLIDDLGVYKSSVLEPNSVVLCSHEAVKRFRVSQYAIDEAKKYVSNVDDLKYVSDKVNNIYNALAEKPLSLMKLLQVKHLEQLLGLRNGMQSIIH